MCHLADSAIGFTTGFESKFGKLLVKLFYKKNAIALPKG